MAITHGYATVAELKAQIWPTGSVPDALNDPNFELAIEAASRKFDERTGRRFWAATETRTFKAEFSDLLFVFDLLSITTLATDADGDRVYETTWAATDYDLGPENTALDGKPYTRIEITPRGLYRFPIGVSKGVQIAGSFGYAATTPALIHQACLLQAARWYKRKDAIFGVIGSADMGQLMAIVKLDPDVEQMLMSFERGRGQIGGI